MRLDYTPDRYTALCLVNRNMISSDRSMMRRRDGDDLDPGVFAALLALHNSGYLEPHCSQSGVAGPTEWPVRASLSGIQLLAGFNLERSRRAQPVR